MPTDTNIWLYAAAGLAAVQRNVSSLNLDTVPSSITLPCSSHHGV